MNLLKPLRRNMYTVTILSLPLSLIIDLFEQYIFKDWTFLIYLIVLVFIDSLLGLAKAWRKNQVSSHGWKMIFTKLIMYFTVLILAHVVANFSVAGNSIIIFQWVQTFICCAIIVREAISILENVGEVYPNLLPKWILAKLRDFDEHGKFKDNE